MSVSYLAPRRPVHDFEPESFDVIISNAGAMFFDDKVAALACQNWEAVGVHCDLQVDPVGKWFGDLTSNTFSSGAGVAAAALAIAAHGVVDAFLSFTATYILIAVTLGLSVAPGATTGPHAHRL